MAYLAAAAHALAYVVIADRQHTDLYEWGQRGTPLSLAAEIQRQLLPGSYTCEAGQFTLAGWLVPAHTADGDTFDYALDRQVLQLSITDAIATAWTPRSWQPRWSAACATAAAAGLACANRPGRPAPRSPRTPAPISSSPASCCRST